MPAYRPSPSVRLMLCLSCQISNSIVLPATAHEITGRSFSDIALAFGCSESTAKNLVALGSSDPAIKDALRTKQISIAKAYAISRKPTTEKQLEALRESINKPKPTAEESATEALRKALKRCADLGININELTRENA